MSVKSIGKCIINFVSPPLFLLMLCMGMIVKAEDSPTRLADSTTQRLCDKYEGKPALIAEGVTRKLNCDWIRKMASQTKSLVSVYRDVLLSTKTLDQLQQAYQAGRLPRDLLCTDFGRRALAGERVATCSSDLGVVVPFLFHAKADGNLTSFDVALNYDQIYRLAMEQAISRGSLSKVYDDYIFLHSDLFYEMQKQTAAIGDNVAMNGRNISIHLLAH